MRDLYMIVSGKVNLRFRSADIFVSGASIDQRYDAEIFADRSYKESFEAGYYTQQEMEDLLIDKGLWSEKEDEVLEKLPDDLEQMKLDYYNNFHVLETRLKVKGYIDKTIEKIGKLLSKKNVYYENTCEGIRDTSRHDYLIERTSFYKDGGFFDFGKVSPRIVAVLYMKTCLDSNEIRQISKLDRWRATWAACKTPGELFGRTVDMTDMQLSLLSWSRVYDNVHESTEVPTEDIIEDDLALDGWFVALRTLARYLFLRGPKTTLKESIL